MVISICDDNLEQARRLEGMIHDYYHNDNRISVLIFANGVDLIEELKIESAKFDLLFLDILMPRINGIQAAQEIRMYDEMLPIIFVTSTEGFAKDGYDVDALYYLTKPVSSFNLARALQKAEKRLRHEKYYLPIKNEGSFYRIPLDEIMYIEKVGKKIIIHRLGKEKLISKQTLKELKGTIERVPYFKIAYENNYLNVRCISQVNKKSKEVIMKDGSRFQIARDRTPAILDAFLDIMGE